MYNLHKQHCTDIDEYVESDESVLFILKSINSRKWHFQNLSIHLRVHLSTCL